MLTDEKEYVSHKIQEHKQRYSSCKKTKNKRGNENSMVVSACQSHPLFGIHICAFVYILSTQSQLEAHIPYL